MCVLSDKKLKTSKRARNSTISPSVHYDAAWRLLVVSRSAELDTRLRRGRAVSNKLSEATRRAGDGRATRAWMSSSARETSGQGVVSIELTRADH